MSTKTSDEKLIEALEQRLADLLSDYRDLQEENSDITWGLSDKLDNACDQLFVNDLSANPGKLIVVDYWGNQVGEWTPEALRGFMESRLL